MHGVISGAWGTNLDTVGNGASSTKRVHQNCHGKPLALKSGGIILQDRILTYLQDHEENMIKDLKWLVESESPSTDKALLDRTAEVVARILEASGFTISTICQDNAGNQIRGYLEGSFKDRPILVLAHYDTVWEAGTLRDNPFSWQNGVVRGPGVFDMKAGLIQAAWACRALRNTDYIRRPIVFLVTSDEEIGSAHSRPIIEEEAKKACAVLVFEASHHGALKTARKGTCLYEWRISGKAAHAGLDPLGGVSAVEELADQIVDLRTLVNSVTGTTVNVGVVNGGTRSNVIAAEASAAIDIRVGTAQEAERVMRYMEQIAPKRKGIRMEIRGGLNRPPMERTPDVVEIFEMAKEVGRELGLDLDEASVGGASDGNFCAALGIPVIDGLGAVGDGAHAADEHVIAQTIPIRAALAARLMVRLSEEVPLRDGP